jgi:hypothetical protein
MTTRPGPSTERILEVVQHVLVAAVSVVIAVVVIVAFLRVIESDGSAEGTQASAAGAETLPGVVTPGDTEPPRVVIVDPQGTDGTTAAPDSCVRLRPEPETGQMVLRVFMACGDAELPSNSTYVYRSVEESTALLTTTMEQLVAGPTSEEVADGFRSFWSAATADAVNSVQLAEGAAVASFGSSITSITGVDEEPARSFFLADIYTSLFQYERVSSVELRIGSDCDAFFSLVGESGCTIVTRGGWEAQLAQWRAES